MTTDINFPNVGQRLVDDQGTINKPWLQFWQRMWLRTGGGPGLPRIGDLLATTNAVVPAGWRLYATDALAGAPRYWFVFVNE